MNCGFDGTHFMVVQLEPPPQVANLLVCKLTATLLAPAIADPTQPPKDQGDQTPLSEERGDDCGPPPLFDNRPRHQSGGTDIVLMTVRAREMLE